MKRRGYISNWQQRHYASFYNFFDGDTNNAPNNDKYIPTGDLPKQPTLDINEILKKMELFYNAKYVWGGSSLQQADCSYFVNYCYGVTGGAYGAHGSSSYDIVRIYSLWGNVGEIQPKDGMILWRRGHVALYKGGYVYEMANSDKDFQKRPYSTRGKDFTYILYSEKINYDA